MAHTVRVTHEINAARAVVWAALSEPAQLARWFGDADRFTVGERFRIGFGDGDFFAGEVLHWVEQQDLKMTWRFMDVGPLFHIRYSLEGKSEGPTRVSVTDRGALLASEADSLREGWADFLERLDRAVTTGVDARFEWSPTIAAAAFVPEGRQPFGVVTATWLASHFGTASIAWRDLPSGDLALVFHEPDWNGRATEAQLCLHCVDGRSFVALTHTGWDRLPGGERLQSRRRYARSWADALATLEASVAVAR